jgi:hypothetical protein
MIMAALRIVNPKIDIISHAASAFAADQIWVGIRWGFQFSEPADMRLQRSPNVVNKRCYYLTTSEFGTFETYRNTPRMSVDQVRSEVICGRSERHD